MAGEGKEKEKEEAAWLCSCNNIAGNYHWYTAQSSQLTTNRKWNY